LEVQARPGQKNTLFRVPGSGQRAKNLLFVASTAHA